MHCRVVPDLLRAILPLLPLEKAGSGKKDKASASSSTGKQAPIKPWDIVRNLQQLGTKQESQMFQQIAQLMHHGASV